MKTFSILGRYHQEEKKSVVFPFHINNVIAVEFHKKKFNFEILFIMKKSLLNVKFN
jgi:hypothetical protein